MDMNEPLAERIQILRPILEVEDVTFQQLEEIAQRSFIKNYSNENGDVLK